MDASVRTGCCSICKHHLTGPDFDAWSSPTWGRISRTLSVVLVFSRSVLVGGHSLAFPFCSSEDFDVHQLRVVSIRCARLRRVIRWTCCHTNSNVFDLYRECSFFMSCRLCACVCGYVWISGVFVSTARVSYQWCRGGPGNLHNDIKLLGCLLSACQKYRLQWLSLFSTGLQCSIVWCDPLACATIYHADSMSFCIRISDF